MTHYLNMHPIIGGIVGITVGVIIILLMARFFIR